MFLIGDRAKEIGHELATRPGHEKVRALVYELLVNGLGARSEEIDFERPLPEVHGRLDALLGQTVFEFKRDLRRERSDAEAELIRYLGQRDRETGERFIGVATDGLEFIAYELRDGALQQLRVHQVAKDDVRGLVRWLESVVSLGSGLDPNPDQVRLDLGRDSLAYARALADLRALWATVASHPDVALKRDLWADLLFRVYGSRVAGDDLFLQHTYLTVVAKTMATAVLGAIPDDATDLVTGLPFRNAGILGAVESDFFDWVLDAANGRDLVQRLAVQVSRYRLDRVEHDVLKGLYESLIDPEQRHDLGEYYTPDWLASLVVEETNVDLLSARVIDPACGSGTFLFHALRRLIDQAETAGLSTDRLVALAASNVVGLDVHPVAVIIARVTWLLALGEQRLRAHRSFSVPVYLGDALQWNTHAFMTGTEVEIKVPGADSLEFPAGVTADVGRFDAVVDTMLDLTSRQAPREAFVAWAERSGIDAADVERLSLSYERIRDLAAAGRNHIWGYIARNLVRPIWLAGKDQRADVVLGNPPWLAYRFMDTATQERVRAESQRLGVWVGGRGRVSHQDLSAYFFARSAELYLKPGGQIAFVLPFAALSRDQYAAFRTGKFWGRDKRGFIQPFSSVRFERAWAFDDTVQPLFPVPSCVLFAREGESGALPKTLLSFSGQLARRDASPDEARRVLATQELTWPTGQDENVGGYVERFRQGAIVVPRVLFVVDRQVVGRFGSDPAAPLVRSRRSSNEKAPWKFLPGLEGLVESDFVRSLCTSESLLPFLIREPPEAVIPWSAARGSLLTAAAAELAGYRHLAAWLNEVEEVWAANAKRDEPLVPRLDFYGQLSAQFPIAPVRIVFAASGSFAAAAVLRHPRAVVDTELYWMATNEDEARYLAGILNSEIARSRTAPKQSRGQWGARHFHKLMLQLPIPAFQAGDPLHQEIVSTAARAEGLVESLTLPSGYVRARRAIRLALEARGVTAELDALVERLLS